ncbi:MAG: hypothetical protein C6Y22_28835 [Hapalosiphonaceae cyanobacterium JJU2]|nr:MAG: hypothetical protein C6Y22_28835 [Hapalosiphonaceae cyanobacterium JJU2]
MTNNSEQGTSPQIYLWNKSKIHASKIFKPSDLSVGTALNVATQVRHPCLVNPKSKILLEDDQALYKSSNFNYEDFPVLLYKFFKVKT